MNTFSDEIIQRNNALILSQIEVQPRYIPETQSKGKSPEKPKANNVSDWYKRFLMVVYNSQYKITLTEICKRAGFPAGTGSRIAEECVKKNFIKMIQVPFGRGRPKYPVLLPEGYEALSIQEKTPNGRGAGYEHTLYQHLIAEHFKELKPKIELNRNGKFIDVGIETNEFLVCIEVAMTAVHEKENIEKNYSLAKAYAVIIACLNEKVLKDVQKVILEMSDDIQNKTEACLISDILKRKTEEILNNQPMLGL